MRNPRQHDGTVLGQLSHLLDGLVEGMQRFRDFLRPVFGNRRRLQAHAELAHAEGQALERLRDATHLEQAGNQGQQDAARDDEDEGERVIGAQPATVETHAQNLVINRHVDPDDR